MPSIMIAGKLPPEEATAAMDALAELAARKPDYTEHEAAEAIRAARERAVGRVAVDADSEMVEMPDGSIKSVAEAKAEGSAQAQDCRSKERIPRFRGARQGHRREKRKDSRDNQRRQ